MISLDLLLDIPFSDGLDGLSAEGGELRVLLRFLP